MNTNSLYGIDFAKSVVGFAGLYLFNVQFHEIFCVLQLFHFYYAQLLLDAHEIKLLKI
jgi:hypothetical protein